MADLPNLLSRLINSSLTGAGVPQHEIAERQVYLLRMLTGILGSSSYARSSVEGGGDDNALMLGLRKEVELSSGGDKAKGERVVELCNRLGSSAGRPGLAPPLRTSLLALLRALQREGRPGTAGAQGGRAPATFSLTQSVQLGGLPPSYAPSIGGRGAPGPGARSGAASALPLVRPSLVVTPSEMGEEGLSAEPSRASSVLPGLGDGYGYGIEPYGRPTPRGGPMANGPSGPGLPASSEPSLVRDVLYAAQGVRGRALVWAPGQPGAGAGGRDVSSGFRPDPALGPGLGQGRCMVLERLVELGWLFRRVREHIACCSGGGCASVRQALGSALGAEVGDFYRLLAALEAQAGLAVPAPGDVPDPSPGGGIGGGGQFLTLRRLVCWLAEPTRRMRLLAAVGDAAEGLEGGALAGAVHEFSRHGDPFVAANATRLLEQVCVPLYGMIRRWVLQGELDDPHGEFFVVQHDATAAVNAALAAAAAGGGGGAPPPLDVWRQSYGLDEARLPPFIGPSLASRILRAGKAIHYLRLACGDGGWVQQRAEAWAREPPAGGAAAPAGAGAGAGGELSGLEGLVSAAVRSVDCRLLAVLWRRHRLRSHWAAIRRFVLLGQGDWVTAFMDLAQRELDRPASDVSEVALNALLRQALTATTILGGAGGGARAGPGGPGAWGALEAGLPGDGPDGGPAGPGGDAEEEGNAVVAALAERLRVRKERGSGVAEVGWDVFSVTYNPAAGMPAAAPGGAPGAAGGGSAPPAPGSHAGGALSAIFTPAAMQAYGRLARLLWSLKRAEHALSAVWGSVAVGLQKAVDKMGPAGHPVQPVLGALLRLRADMSHFATNLQTYIHFEVMHTCWQRFFSRASACSDLDSLIAAHEEHLATLLRKALLANPGGEGEGQGGVRAEGASALRRALRDALSNMVALRAVASRLEELVAGGARLLATRAAAARGRVAAGRWGTEAAPGSADPPVPPAALADIRRTLADLAAQHSRAVAEFTENLPEEAQDDVRFLLARLDFGGVGVAVQAGAGAGGPTAMVLG
ncbi:hypothetical protein HYH03_014544 [Edaphochlamys debaryana]|uniref:Gamma-tubulin complex component n=1 Tax=Edaphochlamys debaryana TaxID=47281 RepID=A0A835XRE1_9CHLO|nr:hypothetical protein HYH03_014544 [Edaphochlamys debaryana]|eukprot:KAG2486861.1 hypothetical protein HYH03_014544 [Edaphochlamys debaryana]